MAFSNDKESKPFVWKKKLQQHGINPDLLSRDDISKIQKRKITENQKEIEAVKKRRYERHREVEENVRLRSISHRQRDIEWSNVWHKMEEEFILKQAKLRPKIRLRQGRGKPIDYLVKYIENINDLWNSEEIEHELEEMDATDHVDSIIELSDLQNLEEDIIVCKQIHTDENLQQFWADVHCIVSNKISSLQELSSHSRSCLVKVDRRIHSDIMSTFQGKSLQQLLLLENNITSKLCSETSGVDVSYWEDVLYQLKTSIASCRLKYLHKTYMSKKVRCKEVENNVPPGYSVQKYGHMGNKESNSENHENANFKIEESVNDFSFEKSSAFKEDIIKVNDKKDCSMTKLYSVPFYNIDDLDKSVKLREESEDLNNLIEMRKRVIETKDFSSKMFADNGEPILCQSQYTLRRPKYVNRVHTGYVWNKYNRTHYDKENPPPKQVMGYKFTVFYPDLMNKQCVPNYKVEPFAEDDSYSMITFMGGPPYEDIAFKIVNAEWDRSWKRGGYRCEFNGSVFYLWFKFVYLGFYVAFNTVQVISRRVV